jgi:DNA replication and repair protein RecF
MHALTTLTLENFRNYSVLKLDVPAKPVVLMGQNGAGKTNILEAISLFSPGRGLRNAAIHDMDRIGSEAGWVVAGEICHDDETHWLGTGRDVEALTARRILKIDGEKKPRLHVLTEFTAIAWLTPQMDTLFLQGNSARRGWLDRLVYTLDSSHAARVSAYEQAMRERTKLLKEYELPDPVWLSALEQQMAEYSVAITVARNHAIERLQHAMESMHSTFPKAHMELHGDVEECLAKSASALEAEEMLKNLLFQARKRDAAIGRAMLGAHKSQWAVTHKNKNMLVEQCSTGEQKAVLLAISIASCISRMAWVNSPPILLLDEVIAHLDVEKRDALFDLLSSSGIQAWLTGTDASDFSGLQGAATMLHVHAGEVEKQ